MQPKSDKENVLIIDDEQDLRDGAERILKRMGCNVFQAARGEEGLSLLEKTPVSIVLLDMKMPGMDGMEVLRHIRENDPEMIVIVITGFATLETAIEAMKNGAYDFIPKPYEPDQLRIVVNRARERVRLAWETQEMAYEREQNLADLDTEKSRLRSIIEFLPNGVLVTNKIGQVVLMNSAFRQALELGKKCRARRRHLRLYQRQRTLPACDGYFQRYPSGL